MKQQQYVPKDDYLIPVLEAPEPLNQSIGKYGRMRRAYLEKNRPIVFSHLVLSGKLHSHLLEIDQAANRRLEGMMSQLAQEAGATEQLKADDPMRWAGLMNTCKAQAEEIIFHELINGEDDL